MSEEKLFRMPCEVYSRIVGYLRPIRNWNAGKMQEFKDRLAFRVPDDTQKDNDDEN